ncbi:hypothetical protein Scep_029287 [Stephania cephalantha]|uniref:Uncharacterized protein n=1 Tax=Stephania cephalantha TaxID=152367 RepID=A0AAP0HFN4_9MAGN
MLISEEKLMKGENNGSSRNSGLVAAGKGSKKYGKTFCWRWGQARHLRRDCRNRKGKGVGSAKNSNSTKGDFDVEGFDVDNLLVLKSDSNYPICLAKNKIGDQKWRMNN